MGWTESDLSKLEIDLVVCLRDVQDALRHVLQPDSCKLIALALERGVSLRQVTELVEAAHRSIEIVLKTVHPTGWRGEWRRFRSRSNPLAQTAREAHLAVALHDGVRVVKALVLEDSLDVETIKMAELATMPLEDTPPGPKGK